MTGVALFGSNNGEVVESSFHWEVNAVHIAVLEVEDGRELPTNRFAEVAVFHWWKAHDGRCKHCILSAGDGCNVHDWVLSGERIESKVITKRPLKPCFAGDAIAFNHDVCFGGNHEVLCERFGNWERLSTQDASELVFAEVVREW